MEICNDLLDTEDNHGMNARFRCQLEEGHRAQHMCSNSDLHPFNDKDGEPADWTIVWDKEND